jgi:hypothetical protein
MPEFHDRDAEHQAWKAKVLAGDIVLADDEPAAAQERPAVPAGVD